MSEPRWVCVAACLLIVVGAGCKPAAAPSKLEAAPDIVEFSPTSLGVTRVRTVLLTNKGGVPLTVYGATATTATVETTPFEPFELKAGDTRELEVRFTPAEEGLVRGELNVHSDASNTGPDGVVRLHVNGQGAKPLVEVKTDSIDFGTGVLGKSRAGKLVVHNLTQVDSPVRLDFSGTDADQFSSNEAGALLILKPDEVRELPVSFEPERLGAAQATARVTVCAGCEPVDVPLSGKCVGHWLEMTPLRVDFGHVELGATAEERVIVRNQSSDPFEYDGVKLQDNESGAFRLVSTPPSGTIAPGAQLEVRVAFSPTTVGPVREAWLMLNVRPMGSTWMVPKVPLRGEGGISCVVLQPDPLDFGVVAEGMSATRDVHVINRCRNDVLLSDLKLTTKNGGYFLLAAAPSSLPISAGQSTTVPITYMPRAGVGAGEGEFSVKIFNRASTFTGRVRVLGSGKVFAPCKYQLEPATVEFGNVPVGSEVMLGAAVRNIGASECFLAGMQMAEGSDPPFRADKLDNQVLLPGQRARLLMRFKPGSEGEFSGMAKGWVNHPSAGDVLVPLRGRGVQGCFSVQPTTLDFGTTRLSCGPRESELIVYNKCPGPLTLVGLSAEGDATDFKVSHSFQFPQVLAPNSKSRMRVTYEPQSDGDDAAALRFDLGMGSPYTVGMVGRGELKNEQTDPFVQQSQAKVDVLFLVDNSGSMMDEQQSLGANFSAFLSHASAAGVDYHIAVTTTGLEISSGFWAVCPGGAEGGENGRFFPVDNSSPRIISPTTPAAEAVFARNTNVGVCHWNEQGLEAMYRALSNPLVFDVDDPRTPLPMDGNAGFLREDARLAIIAITDDEDFSPQPVSAYESFLLGLKGNDRSKVIFSAIAGPEDLTSCLRANSTGSRYIQLAQATGGVVESICTPDWAASLERISESTFGPNRSFLLTELPSDTSTIVVRVDGVEVGTGWTYDPATNTVIFELGAAPAPGATVEVSYRVGC